MSSSKLASVSLLGFLFAACQSQAPVVSADPGPGVSPAGAPKTADLAKANDAAKSGSATVKTDDASKVAKDGDDKEPCGHEEAAKNDANTNATKFGDPLNPATQKVALAELVKKPSLYADKTVMTEGVVTSVCQARGCWLEIGDDTGTAHVKLGSHKFFVPRSSNGKHAKVEATVLPAVDSGHCEEEAKEQTGKLAKVELVATGVELF